MQAPRHLRQLAARIKPAGRRNYAQNVAHQEESMNSLPIPKGSWQANYDKNQQVYNRHLVLGVAVFGATYAFGEYMGFHEMYANPPAEPAKIDKYPRDPEY